MDAWMWLAIAVAIVLLGALAQRAGWIDLSDKTRRGGGVGGGLVGGVDEVFFPTRHEAQVELDRQTVLPAPAPLAGDGELGITGAADDRGYAGRLRIEVDETTR